MAVLTTVMVVFSCDSHAPNGWRYPLVGETRQRRFAGTNFKPHKLPENAQTPTSRVHALLGGGPRATRLTRRSPILVLV